MSKHYITILTDNSSGSTNLETKLVWKIKNLIQDRIIHVTSNTGQAARTNRFMWSSRANCIQFGTFAVSAFTKIFNRFLPTLLVGH